MWLASPWLLKTEYWESPALWIFVANGFMHPLLSINLAFEAVRRMGPTVSATISATSPLFAILGAVLLLGEELRFLVLLGTLSIVFGIMLLSGFRDTRRNWHPLALLFPLGAAAVRGANHIVGKVGLEFLPSAYFAVLISFSVSWFGALLFSRLTQPPSPIRVWRGGLWFISSGLAIALGVVSMYAALLLGDVVVVSPIMASFPLFTLLIVWLLHEEVIRLRTLFGVLLVLAGTVVITLS